MNGIKLTAGPAEVMYTCEAGVVSYCGGRVEVAGPGYLSSPGYPRYYLAGRECVWTLAAGRGQILSLQVIKLQPRLLIMLAQVTDLSLRTTPDCADSLLVVEDGVRLLQLCGGTASQGENTVISSSSQVMQLPPPSSQNYSSPQKYNIY